MSVYPTLRYDDAKAAIRFLVDTLGITEKSVMGSDDGTIGHAELGWDSGVVTLGQRTRGRDVRHRTLRDLSRPR
jgi:uncharacterized glyoxalase superfamily protein PhnB